MITYGCYPCDYVEGSCVDVVAHQIAAVDEQEHEDQDDWEPDAVAYLREDENFFQRGVGNQNDGGPYHDHARVEAVEDWGVIEFVVDARLEAHAFADHVAVESGRMDAAKSDALSRPKAKSEAAHFPASGTRACAASPASLITRCPET